MEETTVPVHRALLRRPLGPTSPSRGPIQALTFEPIRTLDGMSTEQWGPENFGGPDTALTPLSSLHDHDVFPAY